MKKRDTLEKAVNYAYLSIGSNLGNKKFNIEKTKFLISQKSIKIIRCSSCYESPSWPNPKFPRYLNIIIKINTDHNLVELFSILKKIEKKMGRKRKPKNFPRTCDIDIIDFNNLNTIAIYKKETISIPHPRMHNRNFVLMPMFEINNKWVHPNLKRNISEILSKQPIDNITAVKLI